MLTIETVLVKKHLKLKIFKLVLKTIFKKFFFKKKIFLLSKLEHSSLKGEGGALVNTPCVVAHAHTHTHTPAHTHTHSYTSLQKQNSLSIFFL